MLLIKLQSESIQNGKNINERIFKKSSRFEPASFRVDVHDASTELSDSVTNGSNTIRLNKTHFNVTLARPALINSSAT